MSPAELALVFTLGIVIGGIGGLLGLGGGLIAIPLLGLAFGMSQQLAQGTAMVMIVGNTFLGLWRNHRLGNVEAKYAVTMAASAALFTWLTALVALRMESASLRFAFGVFVCVLALYTIWSNLAPGRAAAGARVLPWGWSSVVGAAGGALSGLFGGLAGALYAPFAGFANTELLFWLLSGQVLIMVMIGGAGTLIGPMLGATGSRAAM